MLLVLGLELLGNICETRHSAQCVKTTLQKNYPAKTKAWLFKGWIIMMIIIY